MFVLNIYTVLDLSTISCTCTVSVEMCTHVHLLVMNISTYDNTNDDSQHLVDIFPMKKKFYEASIGDETCSKRLVRFSKDQCDKMAKFIDTGVSLDDVLNHKI